MDTKYIQRGLVFAGISNLSGVLIFSRGFTNEAINAADPVVMSNFGLLMILVWGLAYLGAAQVESGFKWIVGGFAIEKLIYGIFWIRWVTENSITALYQKDSFAGIFYSIYGVNDLLFFAFFTYVFFRVSSQTPSSINLKKLNQ